MTRRGAPALGAVGRADLLRVLSATMVESLPLDIDGSSWFGYVRQARQPLGAPTLSPALPAPVALEPDAGRRRLPLQLAHTLALAGRQRRAPPPEESDTRTRVEQAVPLGEDDLASVAGGRVGYEDLVPHARLMPALRRQLRSTRWGEIDLLQLVDRVAARDLPKQVPRRAITRWHPDLVVVLDFSARLWPYRKDMHRLARRLLRACGAGGVSLRIVNHGPLGGWTDWVLEQRSATVPVRRQWHSPPGGGPVLIVSDLGLLAGARSDVAVAWRQFVRRLVREEARPIALAPVSAEHLGPSVPSLLPVVRWSPDGRMRPEHGRRSGSAAVSGIEDLLALMSATVRVDPPLLRALRRLVPGGANDAGLEGGAWCHPDVGADSVAVVRPEARERYRQRFRELPHLHAPLGELARAHHAHLHPGVRHEETRLLAAHSDPSTSAVSPEEIDEARVYLERLARTVETPGASEAARDAQAIARGIVSRADARMVTASGDLFHVLLAAVQRSGDCIPHWADPARLSRGARDVPEAQTCWLVQDPPSGSVVLQSTPPGLMQHAICDRLDIDHPFIRVAVGSGDESVVRWPDVRRLPMPLCAIDAVTALEVVTAGEVVRVAPVRRPRGARAWGQGEGGLFVESPPLGPHRARWSAADLTVARVMERDPIGVLTAVPRHVNDVVSFGIDADYGVFADVTITTRHGRAVQRLRWIEPGRFVMGSPAGEAQRFDNEGPQHAVTLTRGYWLADTACTQGLWRAVMGTNPSQFQGDEACPVEQVSWETVQEFLGQVTAAVPGCAAGLPTEAEWEYACRAGTTGPFNLGGQVTPAEVNYDGNFPYAGAAKGEYRQRTVPVRSLPANGWGLYEMHGNVWEWCADGLRTYDATPQDDPVGPAESRAPRAVRGGSWFDFAGWVRSAYRYAGDPGYAYDSLGFRLCLRSIEPGVGRPGGPDTSGPPRDGADRAPTVRERLSGILGRRPRRKK